VQCVHHCGHICFPKLTRTASVESTSNPFTIS
jgi:hypothetical protein